MSLEWLDQVQCQRQMDVALARPLVLQICCACVAAHVQKRLARAQAVLWLVPACLPCLLGLGSRVPGLLLCLRWLHSLAMDTACHRFHLVPAQTVNLV